MKTRKEIDTTMIATPEDIGKNNSFNIFVFNTIAKNLCKFVFVPHATHTCHKLRSRSHPAKRLAGSGGEMT